MKPDSNHLRPERLWPLILLASLAGGAAEMIWVGLYASVTSLTAANVAREVTASLLPAYAAGITGIWLGIAVHMLLALILGHGFAYALWKPFARRRGILTTLAVSVLTLTLVWGINFFLILPSLNPVFITLIPYSVTLASKILFALAMAVTLAWPELRLTTRQRATGTCANTPTSKA